MSDRGKMAQSRDNILSIPTLLHHHGVQFELFLSPFHDLFLDGSLSDQAINIDGALLTNAVGTILGLQVRLC